MGKVVVPGRYESLMTSLLAVSVEKQQRCGGQLTCRHIGIFLSGSHGRSHSMG